jgi:hypothetical protein
MRASGVRFVGLSGEALDAASGLAGLGLPAMPPSMASRYAAELQTIASTIRVAAALEARIGEELQLRAAAAEAADAVSDGGRAAPGRLRAAISSTVTTIVAAGGVRMTATVRLTKSGAAARTTSGLRLTMPELALTGTPSGTSAPEPDRAEPAPRGNRAIEPNAPVGGPVAVGVHESVSQGSADPGVSGAARYLLGDPIDPSGAGGPELRATHHDGAGAPPPVHDMPREQHADRQQWACWMAGAAAHEGLPPALPLVMGLAAGGMRNMPAEGGAIGFFGIDAEATYAPPGHGLASNARPDADWWRDHPDAQLDYVLRRLRAEGGGSRGAGLDDPEALARWAHDAHGGLDAREYVAAHEAAQRMVADCRSGDAPTALPGSAGPSRVLDAAAGQLGVREFGANAGPRVDRFLAAAGTPSGNPWCASFVAWSLREAGHEMPGEGWAAVSRWVGAAQAGEDGLSIVDSAHARPGDIVAYDWGGGTDFQSDGHIGFLESEVREGRFTAIEGNAGDAVTRMERSTALGNVVFVRVGGA